MENTMRELVSIIVPCYNEEAAIPIFYEELTGVINEMHDNDFQILFIDDGSRDATRDAIRTLADRDERVEFLFFSRNFGKEAGMYAGLQHARGELTVIMDVDLQDPPSLLPEMMRGIREEGYDAVATRRVNRKGEPKIRSFFARMFYRIMNRITDVELVDGARDFRMMSRKFVNALLQYKENNRFSKGLFGSVGFRTKWIEYENVKRVAGETKWSFFKLVRYSIEGIVAFSTMPLMIASVIGIFMCLFSVVFIIFIIVRKIIAGDPVAGWPSLVCIISFIGGIQLFALGVIGQYLAKTYMEIKDRPIYIIDEERINEKPGEGNEGNNRFVESDS